MLSTVVSLEEHVATVKFPQDATQAPEILSHPTNPLEKSYLTESHVVPKPSGDLLPCHRTLGNRMITCMFFNGMGELCALILVEIHGQ